MYEEQRDPAKTLVSIHTLLASQLELILDAHVLSKQLSWVYSHRVRCSMTSKCIRDVHFIPTATATLNTSNLLNTFELVDYAVNSQSRSFMPS